MYPKPIEYASGMKKIKPFVELYEHEIVFYALQRDIPFQSEECPYMNESIRTDLREFFNKMEREHPGIKNNAYSSMVKISERLQVLSSLSSSSSSLSAEPNNRSNDNNNNNNNKKKCKICNRDSTGDICSVCATTNALRPKTASQM
jgi:uncharacterized protein (TIGR00269 family)